MRYYAIHHGTIGSGHIHSVKDEDIVPFHEIERPWDEPPGFATQAEAQAELDRLDKYLQG
jgi:hypothetical protein